MSELHLNQQPALLPEAVSSTSATGDSFKRGLHKFLDRRRCHKTPRMIPSNSQGRAANQTLIKIKISLPNVHQIKVWKLGEPLWWGTFKVSVYPQIRPGLWCSPVFLPPVGAHTAKPLKGILTGDRFILRESVFQVPWSPALFFYCLCYKSWLESVSQSGEDGVRLRFGTQSFISPLCHGGMLGDLGPVTHICPCLPHRVLVVRRE